MREETRDWMSSGDDGKSENKRLHAEQRRRMGTENRCSVRKRMKFDRTESDTEIGSSPRGPSANVSTVCVYEFLMACASGAGVDRPNGLTQAEKARHSSFALDCRGLLSFLPHRGELKLSEANENKLFHSLATT
jgi:hypothetical protein